MLYKTVPKFQKLSESQQARVDAFFAYLDDPGTLLDSNAREITDATLDRDYDVAWTNSLLLKDRLSDLKRDFVRTIFARGLYAAADSAREPSLASDGDGVSIASLIMAGRMIFTVSSGQAGAQDYRQLTFICAENDPANLGVNSFLGTYQDLRRLIETGARRFKDLEKSFSVMKPDKAMFGGMEIGKNQENAARNEEEKEGRAPMRQPKQPRP